MFNFKTRIKQCFLCGLKFQTPFIHDLFHCADCELFVKSPTYSQSDIKKQCKNFLLSACSSAEKTNRRITKAHEQLDRLEQHTFIGRVFDVGSAAGFFMKAASDRGWIADGNEVSKAAIKWGKDNFGLTIKFGFFENLKLHNSYNAVVMWNTLEHTTNPLVTLQKAYKILQPGGVVFIRVPCRSPLNVEQHYEVDHLFEFSFKSLEATLVAAGFQKVFMESVNDVHKAMDALFIKPQD